MMVATASAEVHACAPRGDGLRGNVIPPHLALASATDLRGTKHRA